MDRETLLRWLRLSAAAVHEQADMLTALDAAIGDADHGTNLDRGFAAVLQALPQWQDSDLGAICTGVARTLISTVGGASGVLYGSLFLRTGVSLAGKSEATPADLAAALQSSAEGVMARGHATAGEKTMLDALLPAVEALRQAAEAGESLGMAAAKAADAAEQGARATIPLAATKGRAANLGPRSVGHQDPGAASSALLFRSLAQALQGP